MTRVLRCVTQQEEVPAERKVGEELEGKSRWMKGIAAHPKKRRTIKKHPHSDDSDSDDDNVRCCLTACAALACRHRWSCLD